MIPVVKIKYVFGEAFNKWFSDHLSHVLSGFVELQQDEQPDFVFGSLHELDMIDYDCVRIGFTAENVRPNFNIIDYAIGFDFMRLDDRYFRYPLYLLYHEATSGALVKHVGISDDILKKKTGFCSFVVSNGNGAEYRVQLFEALSKYKQVDSGGRFLNNVGGPVINKGDFDEVHKFSICFENSSSPGYLTEKLIEAASARTVPIYWGDPRAVESLKSGLGSGLNKRAFIFVEDGKDINKVIERVKELDNNDELYLNMLREPLFQDEDHVAYLQNELRKFLMHIFSQNLTSAYRRGFSQKVRRLEERYKWMHKYDNTSGIRKGLINALMKTT